MAKISNKKIQEFRRLLAEEMRRINAERGEAWFSEEDIRREALDSPDHVIEEQIKYNGTPSEYAELLSTFM